MPNYYLDSSAIVKRYMPEKGSAWVQSICYAPTLNHVHLVSVSRVEVASAFARRCREGSITPEERDDLVDCFLFDCDNLYHMLSPVRSIFDLAIELTKRQSLKA